MLLNLTLVHTLSYVEHVNDNPVDTTIDKTVLNNAEGTGKRHYRLSKTSELIEIRQSHLRIPINQ